MKAYRADKRLGQHFLFDPSILGRIAAAAGPLQDRTVLEVGPGPGGLTRALLAAGPALLVAIDADARSIEALRPLEAEAAGRLQLVHGDALAFDPGGVAPAGGLIAVANLPYNVGTEILLRWLHRLERFDRFVLMFQREVALRLAAAPGSADYGRLAVLAQTLCRVERLFDLPPGAFVPPPKVWSSVVRLVPRPDRPDAAATALLEAVTRAAFGQRRKMLRASLATLVPDPLALLAAAGIDPQRRPETLTLVEFAALASALGDVRRSGSP
ncbi:MAG: 16S rRNA (adenine(1518)-N(6)/adenine(1519)-N(6))-dimethyltransferase RsmA [Geminicoccaceae bacterium]